MLRSYEKGGVFIFLILIWANFAFGQRPRDHNLIVGTKIAEPFVIKEGEAKYGGIAIDLWIRIAAELNLNYEFREYDLEGLLNATISHEVDLAVAPLTITSEREKKLDFSHPFFITGLSIAIPKKEEGGFIKILDRISSLEFLNVVGVLPQPTLLCAC